jgi:hypothetical protein
MSQIRPDRQVLLFSATMPKKVESLVSDILSNPVRVSVGQTGAANEDVTQRVEVVEGGEAGRRKWLMQRLQVRFRCRSIDLWSTVAVLSSQAQPSPASSFSPHPLTPTPPHTCNPPHRNPHHITILIPHSLSSTRATCWCLPASARAWRSWWRRCRGRGSRRPASTGTWTRWGVERGRND